MSDLLLTHLTPSGRSALATMALAGSRAWVVARSLFTPRGSRPLPEKAVAGSRWLGQFGADLRDEVILAVVRMDPFPEIEIHTHGGPEVVRYLSELLQSHGAEVCTWQQFLEQTNSDTISAAAHIALSKALTTRAASILLDQYHGALAGALQQILQGGAEAERLLTDLHERADLGLHLTEPYRVVIAGAPNVGKSTLVNALAGYQRSIVSPIPGTTRDVVTTLLAIDGRPVELADTAGLRVGGETIESLGIEQARAALARADLCLWVLDATTEPVRPAADGSQERMIILINKIDQPVVWDVSQLKDALPVSATTGKGLDILCERISRKLVPSPPPAGSPVAFTVNQVRTIEEAHAHWRFGEVEKAKNLLRSLLQPPAETLRLGGRTDTMRE